MIDSAFERIMTEVWSVNLGSMLSKVEEWVDKPTVMKSIDDKMTPRIS